MTLINIPKNTTQQIKLSVLSGTPAYIFKIFRGDGYDITDPTKLSQIESIYNGTVSETSHIFNHTFDEAIGNYTVIGKIDDSCIKGSKSAYSNYTNVTVYIPVLTTMSIAPTNISINVGTTKQLTAICKDQVDNTITCPPLIWSSSNILATVNSTGLVTGIAPGKANITASNSGIISNISIITITIPTNILLNPGFETSLPPNWSKYNSGTIPANPYKYPDIGRNNTKCVSTDFGSSNYSGKAYWIQTINVSPSTLYSISGYMKLANVMATTGNGAQIIVDWKTSSGSYISSSTITTKTGTIDWTNYPKSITSPSTAYKATVLLGLKNCSGKVSFDDILIYKS